MSLDEIVSVLLTKDEADTIWKLLHHIKEVTGFDRYIEDVLTTDKYIDDFDKERIEQHAYIQQMTYQIMLKFQIQPVTKPLVISSNTSLLFRAKTEKWEIECELCWEPQVFQNRETAEKWLKEKGEVCTVCDKNYDRQKDGSYRYIGG